MITKYNELFKKLACPQSLEDLTFESNQNSSFLKSKNKKYMIQDGVPILISNYNYIDDKKNIKDSIEQFWNNGWKKRVKENDHNFLYKLDKKTLFNRVLDSYSYEKAIGSNIGGYLSNEIKTEMLKDKVSLIIGAGCGEEALELNFLTKSKVIGLDITYQSAHATNHLLQKFDFESGIGIQGDARFLPIKSNSIDFVFSHGVMHHSPDINKSIDEVYRVLKKDGKFCICLYHKYGFVWLKFLLAAILKGNWSKKSLNNYISTETEKSWISSREKNPYTELFSKKDCYKLFAKFQKLKVRAGSFKTPNNFLLKFFKLVENTKIMSNFGSMIYISGVKK